MRNPQNKNQDQGKAQKAGNAIADLVQKKFRDKNLEINQELRISKSEAQKSENLENAKESYPRQKKLNFRNGEGWG